MPLCGPKLSLCGVVLSVWGIIQLSLMGVFFFVRSVALIEDINLKEQYTDIKALRNEIDAGYQQNAFNCWIAALLYLVTLCVSVQQFWMNNKSTYRVWDRCYFEYLEHHCFVSRAASWNPSSAPSQRLEPIWQIGHLSLHHPNVLLLLWYIYSYML